METDPLLQKILQSGPDDAGIEPFPIDAWLAASALQKAIRRGDRDVAERAALTLYRLRGSATWRRLIVIACEDIGIASPDVVAATVEAACDPALRRRLGDVRLLLSLVRELVAAPKDRSADLLAGYVHHHPRLERARATMCNISLSRRIAIASDPSAIIYQRAIAAWSASGIEWNRERRVGQGDLPALLSTFGGLGVPSEWLHVVQLAARRTREPLTVMLPLLWLDLSRARGWIIRCPLPATRKIAGLPLYALDKHTRLGRAALNQFARENTQVRRVLERYVPKRNALSAVQWGAFYTDAASLRERLLWARGQEIERIGIEADLLHAGIPPEGIGAIRDVIAGNLVHLNALRERLLVAHLEGGQ